jgi:hypothetical protein
MTVALWCSDCNQRVNLDLHGNCEHCGNPEVSVVDHLQSKSLWLMAAAVSIALFGVGLAMFRFRHSVPAGAQA